ncbi:MAG: YqaA family protein [Pseudomonadota bacterium]
MFRTLYAWTLSLAGHRHAERWLAAISFIESSVFPIPPDVVLMPMCIARRDKALRYGAMATAASVLGAFLGYAIGALAYQAIAVPIIDIYGLESEFAAVQARFNADGVWWVIIAGFTPLPFKVITIASGVTAMPLLPFFIASVIGRSGRFFLVAGLFWWFGAPIKAFIDKWLDWLAVGFTLLLVGGFIAVKYLL